MCNHQNIQAPEISKGLSKCHLAEVKKQTRGLIGGSRTEIKLLAFERDDQTWSVVPNEEMISYESTNSIGEGVLIFLKLNGNREVQGTPEVASPVLVKLLQKFSRLIDNSKEEQEKIQTWQESLKYQNEELTRRREELEEQLQDLAIKQEELANLDQQRQELEQAWQNLQVQQQQFQPLEVLGEERLHRLKELNGQFRDLFTGNEGFRGKFKSSLELIGNYQQFLEDRWRHLEQIRGEADIKQKEIDQQSLQLQQRQQELDNTEKSLEQAKIELEKQQTTLKSKQEWLARLNLNLQTTTEARSSLFNLFNFDESIDNKHAIDIKSLENLSLQELQQAAQELEQELGKLTKFVKDQEEERKGDLEIVQELELALADAPDCDKPELEQQIALGREKINMFDETLQGQNQNLQEKHATLAQYQKLLRRRQHFDPIVLLLGEQHNSFAQEKQKLESEVEHLRNSLNTINEMIEQQNREHQKKANELKEQLHQLEEAKIHVTWLRANVQIYEEILMPWQTSVNELRQKLEQMEDLLSRVQKEDQQQPELLSELESFLSS